MKLVTIKHEKCMEYIGITFVWAPDDWDQARIDLAAVEARDAYLTALKVAQEESAPPNEYRPYGRAPFEKYPQSTVERVQQMWDAKKAEYEVWETEQRSTRKRFASFLTDAGFTSIYEHSDYEVEVDWGHNHGLGIDPSETETDTLPKPLVAAGREDDDDGIW